MTQDIEHQNHYIADEGKVLQNQYGAFGKEVWLAEWDNIENWIEINEEEIDAIY